MGRAGEAAVIPRFYIAGPMAGYPDLNRAAFQRAADLLRDSGHTVVNPHDLAPHEHEGPCPRSYAVNPDGHAAACYLRAAVRAMLDCSEVVMLPGWEASVGARTELGTATPCGMPIHFADDRGVIRP